MIRRPQNGAMPVHEKPKSTLTFTTAEIGLIDSVLTDPAIYPYAETTVLENDIQEMNINNLANADIVGATAFAFGVFLLPDFERIRPNNLMAMLHVDMNIRMSGTTPDLTAMAVVGRTLNSTIVSSKAAQSNQLEYWTPISSAIGTPIIGSTVGHMNLTVVTPVWLRLDLAPGGTDSLKPIFFGILLRNNTSSLITMSSFTAHVDAELFVGQEPSYDPQLS